MVRRSRDAGPRSELAPYLGFDNFHCRVSAAIEPRLLPSCLRTVSRHWSLSTASLQFWQSKLDFPRLSAVEGCWGPASQIGERGKLGRKGRSAAVARSSLAAVHSLRLVHSPRIRSQWLMTGLRYCESRPRREICRRTRSDCLAKVVRCM